MNNVSAIANTPTHEKRAAVIVRLFSKADNSGGRMPFCAAAENPAKGCTRTAWLLCELPPPLTFRQARLVCAGSNPPLRRSDWLGENVSMSFAAELAFCRMLTYTGLLEEAW